MLSEAEEPKEKPKRKKKKKDDEKTKDERTSVRSTQRKIGTGSWKFGTPPDQEQRGEKSSSAEQAASRLSTVCRWPLSH
jgi:hypothetical protein